MERADRVNQCRAASRYRRKVQGNDREMKEDGARSWRVYQGCLLFWIGRPASAWTLSLTTSALGAYPQLCSERISSLVGFV
jgi:hypothetical protein